MHNLNSLAELIMKRQDQMSYMFGEGIKVARLGLILKLNQLLRYLTISSWKSQSHRQHVVNLIQLSSLVMESFIQWDLIKKANQVMDLNPFKIKQALTLQIRFQCSKLREQFVQEIQPLLQYNLVITRSRFFSVGVVKKMEFQALARLVGLNSSL